MSCFEFLLRVFIGFLAFIVLVSLLFLLVHLWPGFLAEVGLYARVYYGSWAFRWHWILPDLGVDVTLGGRRIT